jgi:predicted ATP-binding protein involved in virulence
MFLKKLILQDVRCFRNLTVDFGDDSGKVRKWTMLLGENGMGKSTILRAAALVTCGSDGLAEIIGDPAYWVRQGATSCVIKAVLATQAGEEREISIEIRSDDTLSSILSKASSSLEAVNSALAHTTRNYFVVGFGASRRLADNDSRRQRTSGYRHIRAKSVATLFDREATLNPLESWAMDLEYRQREDGLATVRNVLSAFLPGMKFHGIDRERGQILFKTRDGIVPLQYLSDGYQNVAGWVGDLLFRVTDAFGNYKSPLQARGLLIIDEIDLHLHPSWQRSLHSFLSRKLPNMQILATTHSPLTAQQADANELHFLHRDRGRIRLSRYEDDPSKLLVNQLLMSDVFGLATDEALSVESDKERYRKLRDKPTRSSAERSELNRLTEQLQSLPVKRRQNISLEDEQIVLLQRVQAELSSRK